MTKLEQEIVRITERFAADLAGTIRRAALEAVAEALSAATAAAPRPQRGAGAPVVASRPKGAKRPGELLETLSKALRAEIAREPGRGIEAIARAMGVPSPELKGPARKLVLSGEVRREGEKRSARYFPA